MNTPRCRIQEASASSSSSCSAQKRLKQLPDSQGGHWTWKRDRRPRPPATDPKEGGADALWRDVEAIRTPTLLFRGGDSKILAHDVAERMVKSMHDARLVVIPRATHNVHSDNPRDFAEALLGFLDTAWPGPARSG